MEDEREHREEQHDRIWKCYKHRKEQHWTDQDGGEAVQVRPPNKGENGLQTEKKKENMKTHKKDEGAKYLVGEMSDRE